MMWKLNNKIFAIVFLAGAIGGCGAQFEDELATEEALVLETSVAETVNAFVDSIAATKTVVQLSASPTASQTATVTASSTPSPTPSGPVAIVLEEKVECKSGPGFGFSTVSTLKQSWILAVLNASLDSEFFVLSLPQDEGICWVPRDQVRFLGEISDIAVATSPFTPTPSLTPTPNIVWRGEWAIWVGPDPLTQYTLTLVHDAFSLSGSFDAGAGNTVSLNGTLSDDYQIASGIWTSTAGDSGTFYWERKTKPDQFVGNIDGGLDDWCGARASASLPSPCFAP